MHTNTYTHTHNTHNYVRISTHVSVVYPLFSTMVLACFDIFNCKQAEITVSKK